MQGTALVPRDNLPPEISPRKVGNSASLSAASAARNLLSEAFPMISFSMNATGIRRRAAVLTAIALALATWSGHPSRIAAHDGQHTALYRVNAGGPSTSGSPTWVSDTSGAPSPYSNVVAASSATFTTSTPINVSDPSIPAGTPAILFQTERYDRPSGADMQWSFPVAPGSYEVRLYFAEIYLTGPGARVFTVAMEGVTVLPNYDIFAEVGKFKGVVKSFTVVADSSLDIVFMAVVENPKINAIEILDPAIRPGELGASPETANFGPVLVGQRSTRTVRLTNLGGTGDPNIDIFNTTIAGVDANLFADNFTDTTVTLTPGQSTTLDVSFAPDSPGAKSASLEIGHSGVIGPLVVPLGGTGATTPAGAWASRAPSAFPRQE